jgi:Tol biopolymer transport system component
LWLGTREILILKKACSITVNVLLILSILGCTEQAIGNSGSQQDVSATKPDESEKKNSNKVTERIVFSSNRSGPWRIWIMNAEGLAMRQLTEGKPDDQDADPAFSRDGKTILFGSNRGGKIGIWKKPVDGTLNPERLCDGDQAQWSPDGTKIVFRRNEKIYIRNLDSGKENIISPPDERRASPTDWPHCSGPAWSPDGKTIAFACRWEPAVPAKNAPASGGGNIIFTVEAAGGEPTKVYDKQGACQPQWSPDGQLLAYETETHICTIRPDGTKNRLITYFGGVQRYPQWSPEGKFLVYCQGVTERGPWEIYIIPSIGGAPVKLTEGGSDMNPDWR